MSSKELNSTPFSSSFSEGDTSSGHWETGLAARLVDYFLVVRRGESVDKPTESIQLEGLRYAREVVSQVPEKEWPDLPLTPNIAMFVFPTDIELVFCPYLGQPFDKQPTSHRFVCTKLDGSKQYCVALQFWQKMSSKDLMMLTQQQSLVLKKALEEAKTNPEVNENIKLSWTNELERLKLLMLDLSLSIAKQEENFEECIRIKQQKISFEKELKQRNILLPTLFDQLHVYEPVAICMASQYPAFGLFEMFLKNFYRVSLFPSAVSLSKLLNQFMFELPVPRPGNLRLQYCLGDLTRMFGRAKPQHLPLPTGSYKLLFRLLALEDIVNIFLSLLTETSVVFCSSSWAVLGHVTEAFMGLIFPFTWEGVYMPVLPLCLWDFMAAPVPFVAGIHTSYLDTMPQPEEVVFVDLDKGEVYVPNLETVPALPPDMRAKFLGKLLKYADIYDVNSKKDIFRSMEVAFPNREHLRPLVSEQFVQTPASPSHAASAASLAAAATTASSSTPYDFTNDTWIQNDLEFSLANIRETFLQLLAKLLKNYRKYCWLDQGLPTFDTAKFVNSHPKGPLRALLTTMVNSQMFSVFVDRSMNTQGATPDPNVSLFDDFILRNKSKKKKNEKRFPVIPYVTSTFNAPTLAQGAKEFTYEQFPLYLEGIHTIQPAPVNFYLYSLTSTTTTATTDGLKPAGSSDSALTTTTATTTTTPTTTASGTGISPWSATATAMSTTASKGPPAKRAPTKAAPKRWIDVPPPPADPNTSPVLSTATSPPTTPLSPTPLSPTNNSRLLQPGSPPVLKLEVDDSLARLSQPPPRSPPQRSAPVGVLKPALSPAASYRQELESMLLAKNESQLRDNLSNVLKNDSAMKQAQQRRVSRIAEIDPAAAKQFEKSEALRASPDGQTRGVERQRGMSRWSASDDLKASKPPPPPGLRPEPPKPDDKESKTTATDKGGSVSGESKDPSSLTLVCVIKNSPLTYPQALNRMAKAQALLAGVFSESDNIAGKHYAIEDDGDDDGIDDPKLIVSWLEDTHKDNTTAEKIIPKLFEPRAQRHSRRSAQEKAKMARKKAKQETLAEKQEKNRTLTLREKGSTTTSSDKLVETSPVREMDVSVADVTTPLSTHRGRQTSVGAWMRGHRTLTKSEMKSAAAGKLDVPAEEHFPGCVREGFLKKQGAKVHSWKRRYFVLQNGKLMYFENIETKRLKGQMIVDRVSTVGSRAQNNAFWFCPAPGGRALDIEAEDAQSRDAWLESLRQVIYASIAADSDGVVSSNVPKFVPSNHVSLLS